MKRDPNGPADTRMMPIVHDALRRDLDRMHGALTTSPYPEGSRREALADHAAWLMTFLHEHHGGEDAGLYPMVRERVSGDDLALLDDMDADHRRVEPAMDAFRSAAASWRTGGEAERLALVAALEQLQTVLLPHLDREEQEAMPLVERTLTQRQWHAWDQRTNVKSKKPAKLGEEGHWLLDGLDERRRQIVLHEVPLVPRYILLWGFGPGYRRRAAARWGTRSEA